MAVLKQNSAFKLKAGSVKSLSGLIPEQGAFIFNEDDGQLYFANGVIWQKFASITESVQLTGTGIVNTYTAATPVAPAENFDTETLNVGTAFTASIPGQTVTLNTNGDYNGSAQWLISSSVPNTTVTIGFRVGGVTVDTTILELKTKNVNVVYEGIISLPGMIATTVLDFTIEADKNCDLTISSSELGMTLL